jgi:hypothetical protein
MTLPDVQGWVIDFRTARHIFLSGNNQRISRCIDCCASGTLVCCHCEESLFKGTPALKAAFLCLSRASCKALSGGCGINVAWRITER